MLPRINISLTSRPQLLGFCVGHIEICEEVRPGPEHVLLDEDQHGLERDVRSAALQVEAGAGQVLEYVVRRGIQVLGLCEQEIEI